MLYVVIFSISLYTHGSFSRSNIKTRFGLTNLVETHHLIPKQWKKHPVLKKYNYDISKNYNLIFLPSNLGMNKLNTSRLLHSGGHYPYNEYVKYNLDLIKSKHELDEFRKHLRYSMKGNPYNIPWK